MKILLVNPLIPDTFWGLRHVTDLGGVRYAMHNLALPTVAALTPSDIEVEILDENIGPIDLDTDADIVGITGYNLQASRMFELARQYRARGKLVVFGGACATLCAQECAPHADVLVMGEAEYTWPRFIADYRAGSWSCRYQEHGLVDLASSPTPRWDLVALEHAGIVPLQTTRGCPFGCEFCDVILYLGREVRLKSPDQVGAEIVALYPQLEAARKFSVLFADDNFAGNRAHAKAVCRKLISLNEGFGHPLDFTTQASLDLARDQELLELMSAANFSAVFVGVETPNRASLRQAGKRQNLLGNLAEEVRMIQSYGIFVWAGMIVGFDEDDESVFTEQLDFMHEANLPVCMVGMLNAPTGTPLWQRLRDEGRLREGIQYRDQADTNILPLKMSLEQLRRGYVGLLNELYSYERYGQRLIGNLKAIRRRRGAPARPFSWRDAGGAMLRLGRVVRHFLLTGDAGRRRYFLTTMRRILQMDPFYFQDAIWHMAILKHFHTYSALLKRAAD